MRKPDILWLFLLVPTLIKRIFEYNKIKMDLGTWQLMTAIESLCLISFFICIGFWIGYEFSKDDSKTFDRIQEDHRKDLKDHYDKLREASVSVEKENSHLKALVESMKSNSQQRERLINFLESALGEEKERNNRTPEEANKQALEAIS